MSDEEASYESTPSEVFFEPVVTLPAVTVSNTEEDEICVFKRRAKLFRYDKAEDPPEWKERGTGYMKILKHKNTGQYRLLMRRDKTFRVCCNHLITPAMELRPNCGSDRAFVWQTVADFADEVAKAESLGIRFPSAEVAQLFKEVFLEGRTFALELKSKYSNKTVSPAERSTQAPQPLSVTESALTDPMKNLKINNNSLTKKVSESGDQASEGADPVSDPPQKKNSEGS